MKYLASILGLLLFSILSFSQTHKHFDTDLSGAILDAKEKGLYALETVTFGSIHKVGATLTKYSYDLETEWKVTIDRDRKFGTHYNGIVSLNGNYVFVLHNEYSTSELWIIDSTGNISSKIEIEIGKKTMVLHAFAGEDFVNILVGEMEPKHKAGEVEEITWFRVSGEAEVESKIIEVPSPNYKKFKYRYWKPIGNNGEELFFSVVYLNKETKNTIGGITEFMSLSYSEGAVVKDWTQVMFLEPEFVSTYISKIFTFAYSIDLDRFFMQTINKDKSTFDIVCFDIEGNVDWKITDKFKGKLSFENSSFSHMFTSLEVFDNGLLGYKLLQPARSQLGQVFLFSTEDGERINKITFPFTDSHAPSLSSLVMYLYPEGQAVDIVTGIQENARKKKDLKGVSYGYSISDEDELLFIYRDDGTDIYRFE